MVRRWMCGWGASLALGLAAVGAEASPILSEVFYDAVGSDDGKLFVEIAGAPGTALDGFFVEGVNGSNGVAGPTIALTGTIGASGLFVVADRTSSGTSQVPMADLLANFDLQNGPDSVVLRRDQTIVDALGYGDFGPGEVFAGEGASAPDVAPGSSLARRFANLDRDDNRLDFIVLDTPTPGTADFAPVPEPGSALLIGLGLTGLAWAGSSSGRRQAGRARSTLPPAVRSSRRRSTWRRRSIGTTSERAERPARKRPSFWTPRR